MIPIDPSEEMYKILEKCPSISNFLIPVEFYISFMICGKRKSKFNNRRFYRVLKNIDINYFVSKKLLYTIRGREELSSSSTYNQHWKSPTSSVSYGKIKVRVRSFFTIICARNHYPTICPTLRKEACVGSTISIH